jgi:GT2 family glycosyltransferase
MLNKLVQSIIECNLDRALIKQVNIIVVDNDVEKTAELLINELKEQFYGSYKIDYFNHPVKGISNVRNELIKKSWLSNPDFIVFIDDDEYVTKEWLNELVETIIDNNADAVRGPVLAKIDETIPDYISCWFKRESYPNNSQINTLTTGNLIMKLSSLKKYNVWFDNRFNYTGSEDSFFGIQIMKKGATIYWADNAIVYETIPGCRANLKWLIKRFYNGANTYTIILRLEGRKMELAKKIFISLIYIIAGICAFIFIPIPIKKKYWGIIKLSEGVGGLAGLINIKYYEYK